MGAIFIVIMDALKDSRPVDLDLVQKKGRGVEAGGDTMPPGNMFYSLVFQAVVALAILPLPIALGIKKLGLETRRGRLMRDGEDEQEVGERA